MLADRSPYGASFLVGSPAFRIILAASCNNNGRISPLCFRAPSSSASAVRHFTISSEVIGYLRKSRIATLLRGHGEDAHVLRAREIGPAGTMSPIVMRSS
jgi:hypothetical protein